MHTAENGQRDSLRDFYAVHGIKNVCGPGNILVCELINGRNGRLFYMSVVKSSYDFDPVYGKQNGRRPGNSRPWVHQCS